MISIRRILCPIDFSDTSRHALTHAVAIAKWYESHVTVLHVIHFALMSHPPIPLAEFPKSTASTEKERQSMEAQLRAWVEPEHRAGVKIETLLEEGNPASRILEQASSLQADLIVMGTHGLSGFERFMLGSVAEKVLRKASGPAMIVPPPAVTAAKVPYTQLLCPVDFSESSLAAFRFACSMAQESDAHLTILHVVDWPRDDEFDAPEFHRLAEEQARARLEGLVTNDLQIWSKPVTKVSYGKPYREILKVAESEETDLIVIGVSGRDALDRMLLGSTTNQIVRCASCPVLALRR